MLIAAALTARTIRRSSGVERAAVNRLVVGSNPTAGVKKNDKKPEADASGFFVLINLTCGAGTGREHVLGVGESPKLCEGACVRPTVVAGVEATWPNGWRCLERRFPNATYVSGRFEHLYTDVSPMCPRHEPIVAQRCKNCSLGVRVVSLVRHGLTATRQCAEPPRQRSPTSRRVGPCG